MRRLTYVYILQNETDPGHFNAVRTDDLRHRVICHNPCDNLNRYRSLRGFCANRVLPSLRACLEPFTPKQRSAIGISAGVIVECADKRGTVCRVRRLPVPGFIRLKHVVTVT